MKKKLIIAAAIAFAVFAIPCGSSALSTVSVASENNTVVTPTPAPSTKPVEEVKNAVDAIDASKITVRHLQIMRQLLCKDRVLRI